VAGAFVLLLCLGIGAFAVLPALSSGDKTPAGAKAAAQHFVDLALNGDYGGFYDALDSSSRASISRSDFITLANCIKMSDTLAKTHLVVGSATVTGNTARVETSSATGSSHIDLVWEGGHWHMRSQGSAVSTADLSTALRTLCNK